MTPAEMSEEARRLNRLLDSALGFLKEQVPAAADAERAYRKAQAEAWVRCPRDESGVKAADKDWPVSRREAWVDAECSDLRYERDVLERMVRVGFKAVEARMAEISLLQSEMNVFKSEARFAQFGPEMTP